MTEPHLTIVIPSYKEAANMPPLLEQIHASMAGYPYDVLVVDDDSPDGTATVVRNLSGKYPVSVILRKDKRGLASAVVDGFNSAQGEIVAVMDADLQHPPTVLPRLVEALTGGADLAVASRYVTGGSVGDWSAVRRVISKGAIFLSHLLLPETRGIKDPMSGYFMFRKDLLCGMNLSPVGYKILLEVICLGRPKQTNEVPFVFENRRAGVTKLSMITQTDYLRHLFSLMKRTGELNRILRFVVVGGTGTLVNLGLLALLKEKAGVYYLLAGAIAFEISVVWNFILNDRFTFKDRVKPEGNYLARLLRFNITSLGGFIIYIGILALLTQVFGVFYIVSAAAGIVFGFGWNFLVNSAWTWR